MLENFAKFLAIITAVIPILHLLDRAKRFSHRRNFYKERLKAIQYYQDEIKKQGVTQIEKDCAAQFLACSNKVGSQEIDYLLVKFPESFFEKLDLLIKAKTLIRYKKIDDNNFEWTSKRNKKQLWFFILRMIVYYFLSIIILYVNEIIIFLCSFYEEFTPFYVSNSTYIVIKIFLIIIAFFIAFTTLILFNSADATQEIYDDIDIKYKS